MFVLKVPCKWFVGGVLLGGLISIPVWAQQGPPVDPKIQQATQQKSTQYTQIEYQRCRSDLLEIWVKADGAEERAKALEEEVRRLTDELIATRAKVSEKPAN